MTLGGKWENGLALIKINLKLSTLANLAFSVAFLFALPFIQGTSNLNAVSSAICLENYVSIIGIILLVPIFAPEEEGEIDEIVASKPMLQFIPYAVRIILNLVIIFVLVGSFTLILKYKGCDFPLIKYMLGAFLLAVFLGSVGLCSSAISGSTILGYMASIGYLILNMATKNKYVGNFYILSMKNDSFDEKYWLLGGSIVLILIAIVAKWLKRKLS
ncbi:MAG TPA: ABC transporter permease [Clostridium sp.]|nr:ABC transporter permease [Clostridium sp.]